VRSLEPAVNNRGSVWDYLRRLPPGDDPTSKPVQPMS
jgi:hypothetical protein